MLRRHLKNFGSSKVFTLSSIGEHIKSADYSIRGEVVKKAQKISEELCKSKNYPFKSLTACNIGNPQYLGQKPLTWVRQGLSLVVNPELFDCPGLISQYPSDIIERSKYLLNYIQGGIGAYSDSAGYHVVRESIAKYIEQRDSVGPSNPDDIFTTNGATPSIEITLTAIIDSSNDGIMLPIPQYSLYTSLITLNKGKSIGYYMNSNDGFWTMSVEEMQKSLSRARNDGINVKAVVVINPGNPTGQVLDEKNMMEVVRFCEDNRLVLLADEVYQDNIYMPDKKFTSFRKVAKQMDSDLELFSFHSLSKGFYGECGIRGGYMEMINIDKQAKDEILKLGSLMICSSTFGQIGMELVLNPPSPSQPSYPTFIQEKTEILSNLKKNAELMHVLFNTMDNITCNHIEGAMYAMPCVRVSQKAMHAAKNANLPVDKFYVMKALEETGIILAPFGYGQDPRTFHFRITIMSPEENLEDLLLSFKVFNNNFHNQYKDSI